ncbi:BON domain-containing protein [Legionella impletisoli]|uniref:Hemolysin n=1 Tax=Legionella impletisoli TaxID=343510 RepID=A0A917JUI5_9GAMM|nr:BON domain-containing protein [Legionella impletisoli]GGI86678.1 hemolysin [Legionella impletisoli]
MKRKTAVIIGVLLFSSALTGCVGNILTGATLFYDRHTLYKQAGDFQLGANVGRTLYKDTTFKCDHCAIDYAVFNGDILLAGHVPNRALKQEAERRVKQLSGYRRLFVQISLEQAPRDTLEDSWITAKIRSGILADSDINPKKFKVITSDQIVYLMGDVLPEQARKVILIARETSGVRRVVKLFKYFHLSDQPDQN